MYGQWYMTLQTPSLYGWIGVVPMYLSLLSHVLYGILVMLVRANEADAT